MAKKKPRKESPAEIEERQIRKEGDELAAAIKERGLSGRVSAIYNQGQSNGYDIVSGEMEERGESEEKIQWAIHDYAIEAVWRWLIDEEIITPDTKERVVDHAVSRVT